MDTIGRSTFFPRCVPCCSFGGLSTASPNSATNSDAFGIAIRNLMGGTARQGALPTILIHYRRFIAFQCVGNLCFDPPVAAAFHLEPALEPIRHRRLAFRATTDKMFDRIGSRLLAGLEPCAGIAPRRPLEARTARDEQIIVSKAEPRAAAIGDRAKLVLVDQPGPPHLRCSFRCQIEAKVSILIHRDLALRQTNPNTPQQPLRSEKHTSELQSLMRISYAVFCLKKKKKKYKKHITK